jgi:hypothetical protein
MSKGLGVGCVEGQAAEQWRYAVGRVLWLRRKFQGLLVKSVFA